MKKKLLLLPIISILLGGLIALANSEVKEASADASPNYHLFVQVEKESDLRVGDTVFLGTLSGTVFHSLGGNPVFSAGSRASGRSEDGKKYWTYYESNYQEMLLMQVEIGAYSNTWSFKSLRTDAQEKDYAHPTRGRYLAYGQSYHDKKYSNIQTYGDINMADDKGQYTSWSIEFRGEEKYAIMKYYGEQYDTHIQWAYYGSTARNNFGYYTNAEDIVIYKEITATQDQANRITIDKIRNPDQYAVYENTYIDLTGLEMVVTIDKGEDTELSFRTTYENDHEFYSTTFAALGQGVIHCSYGHWNFLVPAEIIADTSSYTYFNELKTERNDYRGSYVIVYQDGVNIVQLRRSGETSEFTKDTEDGPINSNMYGSGNQSVSSNMFYIFHHRINGVAHMFLQTTDETYLVRNGSSVSFTSNINNLTTSSAVTIDDNLNIHIGDGILYFSNYNFSIGENPEASTCAKLYKKMVDYTDEPTNYTTFLANFATITTNGCSAGGLSDTTITVSEWNSLKADFDAIANEIEGYDFQGHLANTTYDHGQEAGTNSVKDLIDRYDYILTKYHTKLGFDDFMDRLSSGAYQDNTNIPVPDPEHAIKINVTSSDNNTLLLVVIISTISVVSLASLVILKKKRK